MANAAGSDVWVNAFEKVVQQGWFTSLSSMAYDPQSHRLAVASARGQLLFINLRSLESSSPIRLDAGIRCLCFGANGHLFCGLENGSIATIAPLGAQLLCAKNSRQAITALAWSNQHGLIAASEDRIYRRIRPDNLAVQATSDKQKCFSNHLSVINNETYLLAAGNDNNLYLLELSGLAPIAVAYQDSSSQTLITSGHGRHVVANQEGMVTVLEGTRYSRQCVLPISEGPLVGLFIPPRCSSIFLADSKGRVLELEITTVEPKSALQLDEPIRAVAVATSGDVLAVCGDKRVQVYLRASCLDQFREHLRQREDGKSFIGRITQFFRWLLGRPSPPLLPAPDLPWALALSASKTTPKVVEEQRRLSERLLKDFRVIAREARKIDWKEINDRRDQNQRQRMEKKKLELRQMREERLSRTLDETKRLREFREQQHRAQQRAIRDSEKTNRSGEFMEALGRWIGELASDAVTNSMRGKRANTSNSGKKVDTYRRKDGTRVRGYWRR